MLKKETEKIQHTLADHCKSNSHVSIPGVKTDRLHHYKRLIYNIIDDAIESAYPIARSTMTDRQWKEMIDTFVSEHNCQHPQLFRMPEEVIEFAQAKDYAMKFNIPYLIDILQFEWAEVEIHSMKDEIISNYNAHGDLMNSPLLFSPYCQLLVLDYPVHLLNKIDLKANKGEYYTLVYREDNGTVQYVELTALTHYLLSSLAQGTINLIDALTPLIGDKDESTKKEWHDQAIIFLTEMQAKGVLLGTV